MPPRMACPDISVSVGSLKLNQAARVDQAPRVVEQQRRRAREGVGGGRPDRAVPGVEPAQPARRVDGKRRDGEDEAEDEGEGRHGRAGAAGLGSPEEETYARSPCRCESSSQDPG